MTMQAQPQSYEHPRVVGVDPNKIDPEQQTEMSLLGDAVIPQDQPPEKGWTEGYKKISSSDFKSYLKSGFPEYYKDGMYCFIILKSEDDYMRIMKRDNPPTRKAPGHSSMVTSEEYRKLRRADLFLVFAGEIELENGHLIKWNDASGHFKTTPRDREIIADHWGLDMELFRENDYAHLVMFGDLLKHDSAHISDGDLLDYGLYNDYNIYSGYNGHNGGYIGYNGGATQRFAFDTDTDYNMILIGSFILLFMFCLIVCCITFGFISCFIGWFVAQFVNKYNKKKEDVDDDDDVKIQLHQT